MAPTRRGAGNFGPVLRRLRVAAGLSQEALAAEADLHRTFISLLERGRRAPSLEVVFRLAEALKVSATDVVREVEDGRAR